MASVLITKCAVLSFTSRSCWYDIADYSNSCSSRW